VSGSELRRSINPIASTSPISQAIGLRDQEPKGSPRAANVADPERTAASEAAVQIQKTCQRLLLLNVVLVFVTGPRFYSIPSRRATSFMLQLAAGAHSHRFRNEIEFRIQETRKRRHQVQFPFWIYGFEIRFPTALEHPPEEPPFVTGALRRMSEFCGQTSNWQPHLKRIAFDRDAGG
jgi:hypothetical protein